MKTQKASEEKSKAMINYLKVIVLLKQKTKKPDLKLEAEVIKTLPFLIYLEDNAIERIALFCFWRETEKANTEIILTEK